jgi:preprotein translocase subunit YajC
MNSDVLTYVMFGVLAVLIILMFRNTRKRKQLQEEMREKIVPGAEVMTNFGLFGVLKSIDETSNEAVIETTPGVLVRVHRQTIGKVVTDEEKNAPKSVEEAMARANLEAALNEAELNEDHAIPLNEPKYGERVTDAAEKPARRAAKKTSD